MISLFKENVKIPNEGSNKSVLWEQATVQHMHAVTNVLSYYTLEKHKANWDNLIVKIINFLDHGSAVDIYTYILGVDEALVSTFNIFGINSEFTFGGSMRNTIFNIPDATMIVKSVDFGVNVFDVQDSWTKLCPVTPIRCDVYGLTYNHPLRLGEIPLLTIFDMDVRLLMAQYFHWRNHNTNKDIYRSVRTFVYDYVLTNMIQPLNNMAVVNRYFTYDHIDPIPVTTPIHVYDITKNVDNSIIFTRLDVSSRQLYYSSILSRIKLLNGGDARGVFVKKDRPMNMNTLWCEYISLSWVIKGVLIMGGNKSISKNGTTMSELKLIIDRLNSSGVLKRLDIGIATDIIIDEFNYIKQIIDNREIK